MSDERKSTPPKSITDGAREFVEGILDAIADALFPARAPVLVPVRVRAPQRQRR